MSWTGCTPPDRRLPPPVLPVRACRKDRHCRKNGGSGPVRRSGGIEPDAMQPQPGSVLPFRRRADAGSVRLTDRDSAGLILCGEQYGALYDLLANALDVRADRLTRVSAPVL
jgi:hypothetical protein